MAVTHNGMIIVKNFYHWLNALYEHYNFYQKPKGGSATLISSNTVMFHLNIVKPKNRHKLNWTKVKWSLSSQTAVTKLLASLHSFFTLLPSCGRSQLLSTDSVCGPGSCLLLITVAIMCDVEKMESEKVDNSCCSTLARKVDNDVWLNISLTNNPPLFVINILDIDR